MSLYQKILFNANGANAHSLANQFRKDRMKIFESFFAEAFAEELQKGETISVIDIGGTYTYWKSIGFKYLDRCRISLLNLKEISLPDEAVNFVSLVGDATDLRGIADNSFDLVYSNSCIEHVGRKREWELMRNEMLRVGRYYFLQTPNLFFPIEPHFLIPFFQFFPLSAQAHIIKRHPVSWYKNVETYEQAQSVADSVHLLSRRDLRRLFPDGTITDERLLLFTKSFMVMGKCK